MDAQKLKFQVKGQVKLRSKVKRVVLYSPRYKDQTKQAMGLILNGRSSGEYIKVLWDFWAGDMTGSGQGQVTKGHHIFVPQRDHVIHVLGVILHAELNYSAQRSVADKLLA